MRSFLRAHLLDELDTARARIDMSREQRVEVELAHGLITSWRRACPRSEPAAATSNCFKPSRTIVWSSASTRITRGLPLGMG
jgi:hypothetical protein